VSYRPLLFRRNLLRVGAAAFIPELLTEQGLSLEAAFERAGFSRQAFAQSQPVVPLNRLGLLFKSVAAATAQAEFGLLVGLRAGTRLRDWGQGLVRNDMDVSVALMRIISRPAIFPNAFLTLSVSGNTCTIDCAALPGNVTAHDQLADCAIGFATGALRVLCGPRWRARGFCFAHAPPPDPSRHAALLKAPVSFDANVTAMTFESAWLDGDYLDPRQQASGEGCEQPIHLDVVGEVRAILASWNRIDKPSALAVASVLGLHPRRLNRLLNRTGTHFNRILGEAQYETAQRMLRNPEIPVASIAWSLGYADASGFSRAFRRWSGMTPSEWREAAGNHVL
jgi:AraC-like DNA-binding protein